MHIGVIGTGYVGLVTGACFAEFGVYVTCIDKDQKKVRALKKGEIPFYEPGLDDLVKRNVEQGRLSFSTKLDDAIRSSLVIFIAVGTPPRGDGSADLKYVDEVAKQMAALMKDYKVIVTKSTVPVGTGERIRKIMKKNLKKKVNFDIVSNPEFLREGAAIEDFMRPDRVVLGSNSEQAIAIMKDLYRPLYLIETPFVITNIETAELIKYASNSFLATKISFINEMANLCEQVGADVHMVSKGMGLDGRIGRKFLHPGPGFGGSCFPKDTRALIRIGQDHGVEMDVVKAAVQTNEQQKDRMVSKINHAMGELKGVKIGVLGLAFKPNTNDMREAPAIHIIEALMNEGARISAYDPAAMDDARDVLPSVKFAKDAYDALRGADAALIITEWNQFRNLDMKKVKSEMKKNYFFDLRNVYEPDVMKGLGFKYYSVGRT
ncbi:MAG: UDP-glucose/GDP-mannose dehydrogenase family protein [Nitrospirota bacterium]|nr:MAG: UDP-glucose/GDP-mannose dehydrogenase family protein [Nitrospirota bacterium]